MRRREFLLGTCSLALPGHAAEEGAGTIAWLQADGLWVRRLPDGQPRRIASSAENPRFSPSGDWIAIAGGVVRSDGSTSAPLPSGSSVWAPRQDILAIAAENGLEFFSPRNGWRAPIAAQASIATHKNPGTPVFSADGSQFACCDAVRTGTGPGGEPLRDGRICRVTLAGMESQTLLSEHLVLPIVYAWTRDSRFILYWKDPDFSASVMADGLALFRVPARGGSPEPLRVTSLVHQEFLALSPTENKLALTAGAGRETYERKRVAILDLDSLAVRYVTAADTCAMTPSWSPDGRRIAYVQAPQFSTGNRNARTYMAQRRIWVADASGAAPPHPITSDNRYRDEGPRWSADGKQILFCRLDSAGAGTLWLMGAGGENTVRVSETLLLPKGPAPGSLGFYGYIDWRSAFDWIR